MRRPKTRRAPLVAGLGQTLSRRTLASEVACYAQAMKAIAAALVAVIGLTGPARLGSDGHRVVAEIAAGVRLGSAAKRRDELSG
jgi:hypothetical protein